MHAYFIKLILASTIKSGFVADNIAVVKIFGVESRCIVNYR